jgi:hypothetical protein
MSAYENVSFIKFASNFCFAWYWIQLSWRLSDPCWNCFTGLCLSFLTTAYIFIIFIFCDDCLDIILKPLVKRRKI